MPAYKNVCGHFLRVFLNDVLKPKNLYACYNTQRGLTDIKRIRFTLRNWEEETDDLIYRLNEEIKQMKVLIIPDVHLKPDIFDQAEEIMESTDCELALCLGDIVDDWGCQANVELYEETLNRAIRFAAKNPNTLFCYGNHDLSYLWDQYDHPGYSTVAEDVVRDKFSELEEVLDSPEQLAIIHRIDNCIFSHAGLIEEFVDTYLYNEKDDLEYVIATINGYGVEELWNDDSPLWTRPQFYNLQKGLWPKEFLNVAGHTPVQGVYEKDGLLSTDTFSTYSNGRKFGEEKLLWVDTVTKEWGTF